VKCGLAKVSNNAMQPCRGSKQRNAAMQWLQTVLCGLVQASNSAVQPRRQQVCLYVPQSKSPALLSLHLRHSLLALLCTLRSPSLAFLLREPTPSHPYSSATSCLYLSASAFTWPHKNQHHKPTQAGQLEVCMNKGALEVTVLPTATPHPNPK